MRRHDQEIAAWLLALLLGAGGPRAAFGLGDTTATAKECAIAAGRDAHSNTVKCGASVEEMVDALASRGVLQSAETAGLQRRTVVLLAQRLKPNERLDFEQALTELERAVEIALDVLARGGRSASDDALVNAVLARVAEKIRRDDLDGGASAINTALADLDAGYRRSRITLLEEGVKVDTLRGDAVAVAQRIEMIVSVDQPTDRPAWSAGFRARYDQAYDDGDAKGINFSLSVAIELARRMVATGRKGNERGGALILFGNALEALGERESGTARLEGAVIAFRAALEEITRERAPFLWAQTTENVALVEAALGEKTGDRGRFRAALAACEAALAEYRRAGAAFYIEKTTRLRDQLSSEFDAAS